MSIKPHKTDDGRNLPFEYLPCGAMTPLLGLALKMEGGRLAAASGSDAPAYISMIGMEQPCKEGTTIPVVRVGHDVIWETQSAADMTGVALGSKVTLDDTGTMVTATAGGAAEVVAIDDSAAGGTVYIRF